ncbi:MAG: hypothetical protein KBA05_07120 [Anaerolineaceae bacterium]|jgi:hypothetical protein|nr:hypothetical protein [Anaerolineaceae bacterium]MDI9530953.1 hypothetical protein [Chloroflexota bacterium]HNZ16235.1 hypothetical protein [Anaerolineaceae bacterium]HOF28716.1 hypothetical protein [Anaerolineaceae bacterium]
MKKRYFLLMVLMALSLSSCFRLVKTTPYPPPPVQIDPEPTMVPTLALPTPEPTPIPETPTLPPTVEPEEPLVNLYAYGKDAQIYLFNPAEMSVVRIGDSKYPTGLGADCSLYTPRLSMDGHYLAFESNCGNAFIVYDLWEKSKIAEIPKHSSPDILGDTLLGWAENGKLYYTQMVGGCSFEPELKGPDRMEVYSYDSVSGGNRYEFDLPKVNSATHAYSIGILIDPKAEYVIAWNAACSVGMGTRFLLTTATGAYELEPASWPASFGDLSGHYSAFPAEQYVFGADGGKLYVLNGPGLEWDPNARLMYLAPGASEAQQIDMGSFSELVSQAPLVN